MDGFKVTTTLGQEDWRALLRALAERANDRLAASGWRRWVPATLWIAAVAVVVACMQWWPWLMQPGSLLAAFLLFFVLAWTIGMRQRRAYLPADDGAFIGRVEFVFEPDHFEVSRAHSHGRCDWRLVHAVSHTNSHVMLWIDHASAYTFRTADLPPPMTVEDAVTRLRSFVAAARANPVAQEPAGIAVEIPGTAAFPDLSPVAAGKPSLRQEWRALLRLEGFRTLNPAHLHGRDPTLVLLALLAFALWMGLGRIGLSADAQFMWYVLPGASVYGIAALLPAWAMSRAAVPLLPLRRTLLLVLAAAPIFVVSTWLVNETSPRFAINAIAICACLWIAGLWHSGLRAMTGTRQPAALGAAVVSLLLMLGIAMYAYFPPSLWYEPDAFDSAFEPDAAREALLFGQGTRIDAEIAAMAPGDPKRADLYFLGFAAYGEQRVFAGEITTAARSVAARYGSDDRQLLLVNDRRDEQTYPLASVAALKHALIRLGQRMDPEEDVLFLALSSHGSEDATISVSHEAMMYWRDLGASDLRAMLDESGIRWKVIVISACHAGSFIDSLADDHTIVLTAAAKENTSFGCSDERDLTDFGEAFYRDALPDAANLRDAFETARKIIAVREKTEGREPSDPQAHFSPQLEAKLQAWMADRQ